MRIWPPIFDTVMRTGHGAASGPMGEAVDHSLSKLAPEDIHAIVAYSAQRARQCPSPDLPATTTAPAAPASHKQGITADARGKMVFEGSLRELPRLERRKRDLADGDADRRLGGRTILGATNVAQIVDLRHQTPYA